MEEINQRVIYSVKKGNRKAFKRIVNFYKHTVYEICMTGIKDVVLAEEVSKKVFLYVHYNINQYDTNENFSLWLYLITVKHALDYRNEVNQNKLNIQSDSVLQEKVNINETKETLNTQERLLLLLRYRLCIPIDELSQIFDIPKTILKPTLRDLLEKISWNNSKVDNELLNTGFL
ncbi:hypothetical protein [Halobacillus sp. A5]|uniref:hypothetical protein n=1 Tax=Halobacillus sp. A5 TaxID=2880263 RepID=UPI0020A6D4C4|nr:hypothetical protein [Halobacillus sp. A5]MCP3028725.1 hypothetical protein [Halobacillus sp. A5]